MPSTKKYVDFENSENCLSYRGSKFGIFENDGFILSCISQLLVELEPKTKNLVKVDELGYK